MKHLSRWPRSRFFAPLGSAQNDTSIPSWTFQPSSKDLDVQVTKDAVSIKGERKSETKTCENGVTRSEFRYGSFHRVIPLPAQIQNDKVEAEFNNGILTLNLPKAEEEKNKVIKVNLG